MHLKSEVSMEHDSYDEMFSKVLDKNKDAEVGYNKSLGLRWAISPIMIYTEMSKSWVFKFSGIIRAWLRLSYSVRKGWRKKK
jgi:hypothetical protein